MSKEDAYREARIKLDPEKNREKRLKQLRSKQIAEIESQKKIISSCLSHVGVRDIENCLEWAFGKDYSTIPMSKWMGRWNQRFGRGIFPIYPEYGLEETFIRIGRAYIKYIIKPYVNQMAKIGKPVVY